MFVTEELRRSVRASARGVELSAALRGSGSLQPPGQPMPWSDMISTCLSAGKVSTAQVTKSTRVSPSDIFTSPRSSTCCDCTRCRSFVFVACWSGETVRLGAVRVQPATTGRSVTVDGKAVRAFEGETIIHGKPSGVDNNVSTYGGVLSYDKENGIKRHKLDQNIPFIIGNTKKKRSTKKMVENVAALKEHNPVEMEKILNSMGLIAESGLDALMKADILRVGDLMDLNHGLLSAIGVSTMKLEILCHTSRNNGALGAKLTGAGGGGCMIAIAEEPDIPNIERAIRRRKSESYRVSLTDKGVESKWVEYDYANS